MYKYYPQNPDLNKTVKGHNKRNDATYVTQTEYQVNWNLRSERKYLWPIEEVYVTSKQYFACEQYSRGAANKPYIGEKS